MDEAVAVARHRLGKTDLAGMRSVATFLGPIRQVEGWHPAGITVAAVDGVYGWLGAIIPPTADVMEFSRWLHGDVDVEHRAVGAECRL